MSPKYSPSENSSESILLGVDLSRHHIRLGTVTLSGKLLTFRRELYPENSDKDPGILTDFILSTVGRMVEEHPSGPPLSAIGVAVPGQVNQKTNRVILLPISTCLGEIDLFGRFSESFKLPLRFETNANSAAYAEMLTGVAAGVNDWLYLHIGANVSAGLVLGGELRRGKSGLAGAIGQMIIDPERIGDTVRLESMASADNIVLRTKDRLRRDNTSSLSRLGGMGGFSYDDIISAAHTGDDLAKMMMQRTGAFIAMALADVISLLNLEMVAVGGSPAGRKFLVPAIKVEAEKLAYPDAFEDCRIVEAEMGAEAAVIGAAMLAAIGDR